MFFFCPLCRYLILAALFTLSPILTHPAHAAYVTSEGPCAGTARCWRFEADVWHVEGKSEALRQGRPFYFDGGRDNRLEGVLTPAGETAEMVVEVYDDRYRLLHQELFRARKRPMPFAAALADIGTGKRHVFVYFRRGGEETRVEGRLVY